ncbi:MAG: hypothetical protein KY454_11955 [Actinobacteria bacterium]|nr:hypothetical protein [Actinomycetota bacterium]MBW3650006.1 hypothetical protein [Actinomycetota bacterium]
MTESGDEQRVLRLEAVPAALFLESQDHQHDLIRELQLIDIGDRFDLGTAEVSHRLARLIGDILTRYAPVRSATRLQAIAAVDRGEELVTLEVPIRPGMAEALTVWLRLLEEADDLCRKGELLLLATRPEVRDLRRWYVQELTTRLDDLERPGGASP